MSLGSQPLTLLQTAATRELVDLAKGDNLARKQILVESNLILMANEPAQTIDAAYYVRRLMNHYRVQSMSDSDMQGIVEDWMEDIAGIPLDILRDALAAWRTGPRAGFKPVPGEILKICKENAGFRMALAKRAAEIVEALRPLPA